MSRPVSTRNARLSEGGWYYLVGVLSFGFLAAIPFWHAFARARRPALARLGALNTVADVFVDTALSEAVQQQVREHAFL